jgi:hypothetical protein
MSSVNLVAMILFGAIPFSTQRSTAATRSCSGSCGLPLWARPLSFSDYFGIRHRRFRDQLADMLADPDERVTINRRAEEITQAG